MKILSVNNYSNNVYAIKNKPKVRKNPNVVSQNYQNSVTFQGWDRDKLRILERTTSEMEELGRAFHKSSEDDLRAASKIKSFLIKDSEASQRAYNKLKAAVNKVLDEKSGYLQIMTPFEQKKQNYEHKVIKEKEYVQDHFFDFLEADRNGMNVPVENGILIYGNKDKNNEFLTWLKDKSGMAYKEVNFNINDPLSSFKEIVNIMENAKVTKNVTKERTLLHVKGIDELLTNYSTQENRRNIAGFKNIVEQASKYYQTTIVTTTEKDLSRFEEASIAPHRFGIKVDVKPLWTEYEEKEYNQIKSKVEQLDKENNSEYRLPGIFSGGPGELSVWGEWDATHPYCP